MMNGRLTGKKVRSGRSVRWDIDPESLEAEKERRASRAEPPEPVYRPVFIRLPDKGMPHDPDERRAFIQRLRAEARAAQSG